MQELIYVRRSSSMTIIASRYLFYGRDDIDSSLCSYAHAQLLAGNGAM
ncbi:MAG: hypothetical protein ACLTLQ_18245 [[Clostridium] scindens]